MVRTLAQGVHYNKVTMAGTGLNLDGIAESNNRISSLMRNLESSEWFSLPNLKGIRENTAEGDQASTFQMSAVRVNPRQPAEEE